MRSFLALSKCCLYSWVIIQCRVAAGRGEGRLGLWSHIFCAALMLFAKCCVADKACCCLLLFVLSDPFHAGSGWFASEIRLLWKYFYLFIPIVIKQHINNIFNILFEMRYFDFPKHKGFATNCKYRGCFLSVGAILFIVSIIVQSFFTRTKGQGF